jgi:hypothetical protein
MPLNGDPLKKRLGRPQVNSKKPFNQSHLAATQIAPPDMHGASIIDAQGREIPITEIMIQRACRELIMAWEEAQRGIDAPTQSESGKNISNKSFK